MASSRTSCLLLVAALAAATSIAGGEAASRTPPLASGLSLDFYRASCPQAESIVFGFLQDAVRRDIGLAAALLRLHFHDCFVQGCDASILLTKLPGRQSEQEAVPNQTLRRAAFAAIDGIRARLERACGGAVVSCADIVALAARDAVHLAGGPRYPVPLGRRDSAEFATGDAVADALPPPTSNVTTLLAFLAKIGLDAGDLVALSGGHTLGVAHCSSFEERLHPAQDGAMDKWFAGRLRLTCPRLGVDNTTVNDIRTPDAFDNKYYVDLMNRQGLFTSDQDMYTDGRTKGIVTKFAVDEAAFFEQFVFSMVKMGQIKVLTGAQGQIRRDCSVRNAGTGGGDLPWSVVDAATESMVF
ncbi:hypothetical protein ACP4OV_019975 [Aristida adscensionis]